MTISIVIIHLHHLLTIDPNFLPGTSKWAEFGVFWKSSLAAKAMFFFKSIRKRGMTYPDWLRIIIPYNWVFIFFANPSK